MTNDPQEIRTDAAVDAIPFIAGLLGEPLTLAALIEAIRQGENESQTEFATRLGISRSHLCDIEKGRKAVSPERAARFAELLGYSSDQFVRLALQDSIDRAGLRYRVQVTAAVSRLREAAAQNGIDRLSDEEITEEIAAARRERPR